ncbi:MAG TPA: response regulator [Rhodanobacteraceae bacterium]|nr:response regulator [Rhodanobacteraceae bacterium]
MTPDARPRILLAEDDAVSRAFLSETLRRLGGVVVAVEDGTRALEAARRQAFELLILDRSLPGLHGDLVLRALRSDRNAASRETPAIATTAESAPDVRAALGEAGFARVLMKPLDAASLRESLDVFGLRSEAETCPVLDDAAGSAASGSAEILSALRGLFAAELDAFAREFDDLRRNREALDDRLHRLRAACGFCGATSLQAAAAELSDALRSADPVRIAGREAAFSQALAATAEALRTEARAG